MSKPNKKRNSIQFFRKQRSLTQVQLAESVQCPEQDICCSDNKLSRYERGDVKRMDPNILLRIADILEVTMEELLQPREEDHDA